MAASRLQAKIEAELEATSVTASAPSAGAEH